MDIREKFRGSEELKEIVGMIPDGQYKVLWQDPLNGKLKHSDKTYTEEEGAIDAARTAYNTLKSIDEGAFIEVHVVGSGGLIAHIIVDYVEDD